MYGNSFIAKRICQFCQYKHFFFSVVVVVGADNARLLMALLLCCRVCCIVLSWVGYNFVGISSVHNTETKKGKNSRRTTVRTNFRLKK